MQIRVETLEEQDVITLLEEHMADMHATSPPESIHALDVTALKAPEITVLLCPAGRRAVRLCGAEGTGQRPSGAEIHAHYESLTPAGRRRSAISTSVGGSALAGLSHGELGDRVDGLFRACPAVIRQVRV